MTKPQDIRDLPLVSVCIANYNGIGMIDDCIASVLAQDCDFPVEIIVHDDASTDGSVQHIQAIYPGIRLVESAENVGFCIANNRMAGVAQGKFLLLLNNDAELFPDALRTMHQEAEQLNRPAILSLPQYDFDSGKLIDRGCLLDPFFNPVPNLDPDRHDVAMVIGACLWIPKALWQELGGFPEWFGSIAEDMYLCCRARLLGHPVRVLGISGYRHRSGASFGGGKVTADKRLVTTQRRRALSERNKSFVMALTYPAPLFQCLFPLHLILLLAEGSMLALFKRKWGLFSNIYLTTLNALWQERRRLHLLRSELQVQRRMGRWRFFSVFSWIPHKLCLLLMHGVPHIR